MGTEEGGVCHTKFWDKDKGFTDYGHGATNCFLRSLPAAIPAGVVILGFPFQMYILYRRRRPKLPWTPLNCLRLAISLILCIISLIWFIHTLAVIRSVTVPPIDHIYAVLMLVSMVLLFIMMLLCVLRGCITSMVVTAAWFCFLVCGCLEFVIDCMYAKQMMQSSVSRVRFVLFMIHYPLVVIEFILVCIADKRGTDDTKDGTSKTYNPYENASFANKITFFWFTPLALKGWRKTLTWDDIWELNEDDKSKKLIPLWESKWNPAVEKYEKEKAEAEMKEKVGRKVSVIANGKLEPAMGGKDGKTGIASGIMLPKFSRSGPKRPSTLWTMARCFYRVIVMGIICRVISSVLDLLLPILMAELLKFAERPQTPIWHGIMIMFGMFLVGYIKILFHSWSFYLGGVLAIRCKTVLTHAVFVKALRLSNVAKQESTVGAITNLMAVDIERITLAAQMITLALVIPLQIILVMIILYDTMGVSTLAGDLLLFLMVPINYYVSKYVKTLNRKQMDIKDKRISLMSEVLNGIKVLKLYAWEPAFIDRLEDFRNQELRYLRKARMFNAFVNFLLSVTPILVSVVTFATFVLIDPKHNILTPQKAFVSLSLFNILAVPLGFLPLIIVLVTMAYVSNKRLNSFLLAEELDTSSVSRDENRPYALLVRDASFKWNYDQPPILTNIQMEVPAGSLVAVVGKVGCGKTSLLEAMLGEMIKEKGLVNIKGSIGYVPQQAWIQNATVRDNILFSKPYDPNFYKKVLDACALEADLKTLAGGDMTEIGEKGINLSGGQKQRMSLARAVYQEVDVYLLDDPLSAVDSHVGAHIFEHVIGHNGILQNKTRILVTNSIGLLRDVDEVVVLKDGRISEMGTYEELIRNQGPFAEFLELYLSDVQKTADSEAMSLSEDMDALDAVMSDLVKANPQAHHRISERRATSMRDVTRKTTDAFEFSRQISLDGEAQRRGSAVLPSILTKSDILDSLHSLRLSHHQSEDRLPNIVRDTDLDSPLVTRKMTAVREDGKKSTVDTTAADKVASEAAGSKLIAKETAAEGKVKWSVYWLFFKSLGIAIVVIILVTQLIAIGFDVGTRLWLTRWSDYNAKLITGNVTKEKPLELWLGVYAGLGLSQGLFTMFISISIAIGIIRAATQLHGRLLNNIMRCPMAFFDTTPLGRILNRFSKDIDTIDNTLGTSTEFLMIFLARLVAVVLIVIISTPIIIAPMIPLSIVFILVQKLFVCTARQLKRMDGISRSPIYSHFQESLLGANSIRAYRALNQFIAQSQKLVEKNNKVVYLKQCADRWLGYDLDFASLWIVFFATLFVVVTRDKISPGTAGVTVSFTMTFAQIIHMVVRQSSEVEADVVSVERIEEYCKIENEAPWKTDIVPPSTSWPDKGRIVMDHYAVRYRPELELVIRGISCRIRPAEKIGIVGRTGAGKSSLTLSLFRLIEAAEGGIIIDAIDISKLGLHDLRARLTIIPQEPVLFTGNLRNNLDPFSNHSDSEVWRALELAHLKTVVSATDEKLEAPITEGGENLSVGQRQLICLARAILRHTKVLILDEATAAVDLATDDLIQKTIRQQFADATILTIAHRLNTIMDSTRIMVLDKGQIAEFDSPERLLSDRTTIFYGMAREAGIV